MMNVIERFKKKMSIADENGCIMFIGAKDKIRGYGKFCMGSRIDKTKNAYSAHRVSYKLFVGDIPEGMCVLHKCDRPLCINPLHLFLGTQSDNMKDMISKKRDIKNSPKGSMQGSSKLKEKEVYEIKIKLKDGVKSSILSDEYNVSRSAIGMIKRNINWKHITI